MQEILTQLAGPFGGLVAIGFILGGATMFTAVRKGWIAAENSTRAALELAAAVERIKHLEAEVERLKLANKEWDELKTKLAMAGLAEKTG